MVDPPTVSSIVAGHRRRRLKAAGRLFPALAALMLAGSVLAGCALGVDSAQLAPLDAANVPDMAPLAAKIQSTFQSAKLTGYPRVSPVRKAPVSALGDWIVCLRSDAEADPRVYALLIQNNDVVDYRLALIIDGCANERFAPLPTPNMTK
jgi:hypothetical protein